MPICGPDERRRGIKHAVELAEKWTGTPLLAIATVQQPHALWGDCHVLDLFYPLTYGCHDATRAELKAGAFFPVDPQDIASLQASLRSPAVVNERVADRNRLGAGYCRGPTAIGKVFRQLQSIVLSGFGDGF